MLVSGETGIFSQLRRQQFLALPPLVQMSSGRNERAGRSQPACHFQGHVARDGSHGGRNASAGGSMDVP